MLETLWACFCAYAAGDEAYMLSLASDSSGEVVYETFDFERDARLVRLSWPSIPAAIAAFGDAAAAAAAPLTDLDDIFGMFQEYAAGERLEAGTPLRLELLPSGWDGIVRSGAHDGGYVWFQMVVGWQSLADAVAQVAGVLEAPLSRESEIDV